MGEEELLWLAEALTDDQEEVLSEGEGEGEADGCGEEEDEMVPEVLPLGELERLED